MRRDGGRVSSPSRLERMNCLTGPILFLSSNRNNATALASKDDTS